MTLRLSFHARLLFGTLAAILIAGTVMIVHIVRTTPQAPSDQNTAAAAATDPPARKTVSFGGNTMGGTWSVKFAPPFPQQREKLYADVQSLLDRLEAQMSTYRPGSEVTRFNRNRSTDWIAVPRELAEVVATAQRVSQESNGAFDVTVAPLVNLWGFGPERAGVQAAQIPSDARIAAAKARVDYRRLHVRQDPPALRKDDPELAIDLSAIAKGDAANRVAALLDARGFTDHLIAIGGELRGRGASSGESAWPVGIEVPTPDVRRVLRRVDLHNASLSTSGNYRNFVELAGQRFGHEIDPKTGRPVNHALASVSVLHSDGAYADAMATALFVLGPDAGYELAKRMNLSTLFITRGDGEFVTRGTGALADAAPL
jgi:thiamine biosynthesis lipoprotein